jgi:cell wall assembly regulator SMI1
VRTIVWKYVKPLQNSSAIDEFEKTQGVNFPTDMKICLKANNGGRPMTNIFDTDTSKGRVFGALFSFNKEDNDNIYTIFSVLQNENKDLLPFARDPAGNILCVLYGKVVLWLHETGTYEIVAESFTLFLDKLYT